MAFKTVVILEANQPSVQRTLRELGRIPGAIDRAIGPAINKTLNKGRTMVKRQLFEILAVTSMSAILKTPGGNERIRVVPYGQESAYGGTLRIMSRPIGSLNFETSPGKSGMQRKLFRNSRFIEYPGSFIGVGLNNNRHLFQRGDMFGDRLPKRKVIQAHYKPNIGKMKEPIRNIKGLSLLTVYKSRPKNADTVRKFLADEFPEQFASQADRILGRSKSERAST